MRSVEPPSMRPQGKDASGPVRVLVADDDRVIHDVLAFFLTQSGYLVKSAFNGRQALEMAEVDPPDLLLLDGMMPELNGYEVLERWCQHPVLAKIPVVMLTAQKDAGLRIGTHVGGTVEFLAKPFSPDDLIMRVSRCVGRHG